MSNNHFNLLQNGITYHHSSYNFITWNVLVITLNVTTTWNISETTVSVAAQMINTLISMNKQP